MSRNERYYQPQIVPCECGSTEPYWHGPETGRRDYCCDACWDRKQQKERERQDKAAR